MADINISDFSTRVQDYVQKFNINGDEKINEGTELNALLAGDPNLLTNTDTVEVKNSKRRVYRNDPELVQNAIDNYNKKSSSERHQIVDSTKVAMDARLEALDLAIKSDYNELDKYLENTPIKTAMMPMGGSYTWEQLWTKTINENINEMADTVNKLTDKSYVALQTYVPGNDLLYPRGYILVDTQKILNEMGFDSIESLAKEIAKNSIAYNIEGGNYTQGAEDRTDLLASFLSKVSDQLKQAANEYKQQDENQASNFRSSYNAAKPYLEATVLEGITKDNAPGKVDYPTGRIFEENLIKAYMDDLDTGINNPTSDSEPDADGFVKRTMKPYGVVLMNQKNGAIKTLGGQVIKPARQ